MSVHSLESPRIGLELILPRRRSILGNLLASEEGAERSFPVRRLEVVVVERYIAEEIYLPSVVGFICDVCLIVEVQRSYSPAYQDSKAMELFF